MRDILIENTERFADGLPANNALLWGARGMGKSSLVKAAHADINTNRKPADRLKLIEIHREDIESLPGLMDLLRNASFRFIVFCDDLSFDGNDASYKSLKAVLEGGIEGRPDNVILYATSNRRHLLAREMIENERSTAINPGEAVEEKVSLSDRFGLWLGFHRCSQDEYLAMVKGYCTYFGIKMGRRRTGARGAGMVDNARLALGARRLAVHAGTGGTAWDQNGRKVTCRSAAFPRTQRRQRVYARLRRAMAVRCRAGVQLYSAFVMVPALRSSARTLHRVRDTRLSRPVEELKRVNRRRSFADLEVELPATQPHPTDPTWQ